MAMAEDEAPPGSLKSCQWFTAKYDGTEDQNVNLVTDDGDFKVPKDVRAFRVALKDKYQSLGDVASVYSPSSDDTLNEQEKCCIVVMGQGEIGKTALISKFVKGVFPHDYDPTIQDSHRQQIPVGVCSCNDVI